MHAKPALQCGNGREQTNEEATAGIGGDLKVAWTIMKAVEMERGEGRIVIHVKREGRKETSK